MTDNTPRTFIAYGRIIASEPLATCSKDLADREGGSTLPTPIPTMNTPEGQRLYFPASGIRGGLRRACRNMLRESMTALTGKDERFTLEQHYMLTLGGIKGSGKTDSYAITALEEWRNKNPLLSLFGAGDAGFLGFVTGRLAISNAVCREALEPEIFSGARANDLFRSPENIRYLSDEDVNRLVQQSIGYREIGQIKQSIKALNLQARKAEKAGDLETATRLKAQVAELKEQEKSIKDDSKALDNSVGMPLAGFKCIPQGAEMNHNFKLLGSRPDLVELGCLIESLNSWSKEPILGAHRATGCGTFAAHWDLSEVTLEGKQSIGHISLTPFEPLVVTGEILLQARQAFKEYLASGQIDLSVPQKASAKNTATAEG